MVAEKSLQEKVRATRKRRQRNAIVKVPIPGWPMLIGRYHSVDWHTKGEIDLSHESEPDQLERIRLVQADFLIAASDGVEALDGAERTDLGMRLGLELANWLEVNESTSDGMLANKDLEALLLIIDDGEDLISHASEVHDALRSEDAEIDRTLVGESEAVS